VGVPGEKMKIGRWSCILSRMFKSISSILALLALPAFAQPAPKYEVYGIRYATLKNFSVAGLVAGADKSRKEDIAMYIWLVKGGGHNILFDCGFYRDQFMRQWHPADYQRPDEALKNAGLKPEDITDVVISHIHWDHADGFDLFPNAKIWIQREELEYYAGEAWQGGKRRTAADPDDLLGLVKLNTQGKVNLVHGDNQEILPGIICYTGGKHTWQSQFISVETAGGRVVLASDNIYMYENIEKHVPIAATLDPESNLRAQDRAKQIASSPKFVLPGHDAAVMKNFPEVGPGVVRIQ
jgi:glyoxylase-like metal-dependent hydrolase (beta-lactamase superfamily II)